MRSSKSERINGSELLQLLKGQDVSELNDLISDREKSAALRAWLARFVVDSKLRSRGFRERMRAPVKELRLQFREHLEELEADFRARFPDLGEQWQVMFPLVKELAGVDNDRKFEALHIDPFLRGEEGEKRYRWYEEGSWRFDQALDGRNFITSDLPSDSLLLGPEPKCRNWMWFVMPLTAELRLMGMCGDARMESGPCPADGSDERKGDGPCQCVRLRKRREVRLRVFKGRDSSSP